MYTLDDIKKEDQEIASAITDEFERQNSHIELIASENWVSPAVMSAALRCSGQHGSTVRHLKAGRYHHGNES